MMRTLLKATLMVLGAGCVLLFAGGFPLMGAPAVYHGGAMFLLGILAGLLALWGGLRIARGSIARLLFGLFCCFMAGIGLVMVMRYGSKAIDYAGIGGAMWFGAIAMGCIATVGVIFSGLFGFFAKKLMQPRLWLAGAHVACFLVLLGSYLDYAFERRSTERLRVDGAQELICSAALPSINLPFRLRADDFAIDYYDGGDHYSMLLFDHATLRWQRLGAVEVEGDELVYGEQRWPKSQLKAAPGMPMPRPLLVAGQRRVIVKDAAPVKEYRARCHVMTKHRGRDEARDEILKVNEPVEVKGWQVTLMSHEQAADGTPQLVLQLRYAPGRFWTLTGMLGLILCTACWCWQQGGKMKEKKEVTHA